MGIKRFEIKNMAQINSIEMWVINNKTEMHHALFNVIRYSHGVEISSLLSMKRADAIQYVELGVIMTNKESGRTSKKRLTLSGDLYSSLRKAIELSEGEEFLFSSRAFGANRAAKKKEPLSRQSAWRFLTEAASQALVSATRNSGITDKIEGFGPMSLIDFEQGSVMLERTMSKLVSSFGDSISERLLECLRNEINLIRIKNMES